MTGVTNEFNRYNKLQQQHLGKIRTTDQKITSTGPTLITHNFPPEGSSTVRKEIGIIWNVFAQHSRRGGLLLAA